MDLVQSPLPYVVYNALLESGAENLESQRNRLLSDIKISGIVHELQSWPGPRLSSHKSANQFFHKLVFLTDIGLTQSAPGMQEIVSKILSNLDEDGVPCIKMEIPVAYGGSGTPEDAWALCDAPSTLFSLVKLGVTDTRIQKAVDKLASFSRENGFGCNVSKSLGNWRGPGKKSDPCPYATLITLKLLILFGQKYAQEIAIGAECLLGLWENSREQHPYIFYMGTDFRKLKLPFVWYDILHVTDVLSRVDKCKQDPRLGEMVSVIKEKETADGYIPESVYQAWKNWDFGQKTNASDWMTFCIRRIENRLSELSPRDV